eukprot:1844901-Rhodomonas_salina.1
MKHENMHVCDWRTKTCTFVAFCAAQETASAQSTALARTHTQTHTHTDRQTDTHTDRHTHTQSTAACTFVSALSIRNSTSFLLIVCLIPSEGHRLHCCFLLHVRVLPSFAQCSRLRALQLCSFAAASLRFLKGQFSAGNFALRPTRIDIQFFQYSLRVAAYANQYWPSPYNLYHAAFCSGALCTRLSGLYCCERPVLDPVLLVGLICGTPEFLWY